MKVQKRNGQIVNFDIVKIGNAVKKAFDSKHTEYDSEIVKSVDKLIRLVYANKPVPVEVIQDYVERALYLSPEKKKEPNMSLMVGQANLESESLM